jgi:hypothetical protein
LYLVFSCPNCGCLRYAKKRQKTAVCFRCHNQIPVDPSKIIILYRTENRREAIEALQKLKMKKGMEQSKQSKFSVYET